MLIDNLSDISADNFKDAFLNDLENMKDDVENSEIPDLDKEDTIGKIDSLETQIENMEDLSSVMNDIENLEQDFAQGEIDLNSFLDQAVETMEAPLLEEEPMDNVENNEQAAESADNATNEELETKTDAIISEVQRPEVTEEEPEHTEVENLDSPTLPDIDHTFQELSDYIDGNLEGRVEREELVQNLSEKYNEGTVTIDDIADVIRESLEKESNLNHVEDYVETAMDISEQLGINPLEVMGEVLNNLEERQADPDLIDEVEGAVVDNLGSNMESTYPIDGVEIPLDTDSPPVDPYTEYGIRETADNIAADEGLTLDQAAMNDTEQTATDIEAPFEEAKDVLENSDLNFNDMEIREGLTDMGPDLLDTVNQADNGIDVDNSNAADVANNWIEDHSNEMPQDVEVPEYDPSTAPSSEFAEDVSLPDVEMPQNDLMQNQDYIPEITQDDDDDDNDNIDFNNNDVDYNNDDVDTNAEDMDGFEEADPESIEALAAFL